ALGEDDAPEVELEQGLGWATPRGGVQGREGGDLGFAEDIDAVRGEPLGVPGEHGPRARRFGGGNLAIEPHVSRERLELQQIAFAVEQVAYLGLRHRGSRSRARRRGAARRRVGSLSSCRRTLATARSSAVRWSAPRAVPTCTAPRPVCNRTSTVGRPCSATNTTRPS